MHIKSIHLDEEQRLAVEAEFKKIIISAGPGSGKTKVMAERMVRLIERKKVSPEKILAVTFTNRAADELSERIVSTTAKVHTRPLVATFHSLCFMILRKHGEKIGLLPEIKVLEENKNKKTDSDLNFDDLIIFTIKLLKKRKDVRKFYKKKWRHILVDEYQDVDHLQNELLELLCGKETYMFLIGDPDQSIYSFRGSDASFFQKFKKRHSDAFEIKLSKNYRSSQEISNASLALLGNTPIFPIGHNASKIHITKAPNAKSEALHIIRTINTLLGGIDMNLPAENAGIAPYVAGDIAVFYRLNTIGKFMEPFFAQSSLPFRILKEEEYWYEKRGAVTLMSAHAAKGLEFPVVFIAGAEEGLFPYFKDNEENTKERLAEEKRLFYVAMTRAKEKLFISGSARRTLFGKTYETKLSRFLKLLPEGLVEYNSAYLHKSRRASRQQKLF